MSQTKPQYDIEGLRARVAEDAGCPEFPALAEALRRAGEVEEACRISEQGLALAPARLAGRVSLGLALLDRGESERARQELAGILDALLEPHRREPPAEPQAAATPTFSDGVADAELDLAFDQAEARADEMISPNRMAEQVLLDHAAVDTTLAEIEESQADEELEEAEPLEPLEFDQGSPFGTATMASLLERQGDHARAQAIRDSLRVRTQTGPGPAADRERAPGAGEPAAAGAGRGRSRRARVLAKLESWLQNIQRGAA